MKEDFNRLRLKYHGDPEKMDEILQRECRYKTASKLPETLTCAAFRFPSLAVAEMATSDAVAAIHAAMIPEGSQVLDMTCGLGIDSFRFARKAARVTAVELDHAAYTAACHNAAALGLSNVRVIKGDSIAWLAENPGNSTSSSSTRPGATPPDATSRCAIAVPTSSLPCHFCCRAAQS